MSIWFSTAPPLTAGTGRIPDVKMAIFIALLVYWVQRYIFFSEIEIIIYLFCIFVAQKKMTMVNYLHCLFWRFIKGTYKFWPDSVWLRFIYWHRLHRNLNLKNPRRFTEKLNWLKLHDRNPLYTILVDKYEVKQYIKEILGEN